MYRCVILFRSPVDDRVYGLQEAQPRGPVQFGQLSYATLQEFENRNEAIRIAEGMGPSQPFQIVELDEL